MANSVETVATFYGIALAGGVIVPINTRYRARELPFVISNAELAMIVTSDRIDDYVDLLALLAEAHAARGDAARRSSCSARGRRRTRSRRPSSTPSPTRSPTTTSTSAACA